MAGVPVAITPRWYQEKAKSAFFDFFQQGNTGNPLIALPTGAGKSFVIADILQTIFGFWPDQRIIVATHVKELIEQNFAELKRIWPNAHAGIFSAGLKRHDTRFKITFAGVQSLVGAIDEFRHIDLLFIDECHLVGHKDDSMYLSIIAALKKRNPYLKIIGLTATPYRAGGKQLIDGPIFTNLIYDICDPFGFERLFNDGFLVPPRSVPTDFEYDTTGSKIVGGDFSNNDLQRLGKSREHTERALKESLRIGRNRNCRLVFCCGVEHTIMADQILRGMGVKSGFVHSKMSEKDRDAVIKAWKSGEIDTLCNNGICTTGVNHPPLDHIIMLRPTQSPGLWVQMLGRGTRPYQGKVDCLVTDHGGNARRLGTIDAPELPKKGKAKPGNAPVRICDQCGAYCAAAARKCNLCNFVFPPPQATGFEVKPAADTLVRGLVAIEEFKVDNIYYTQYTKRNAEPGHKPVMRVLYRCGFQEFVEYVPFEGDNYARKRGVMWWKERYPGAIGAPETLNEAMEYIGRLKKPSRIRVNMAKKYPEVVHYEYE